MKLESMFYNVTYNLTDSDSRMRYAWGIDDFDMEVPLAETLTAKVAHSEGVETSDIHNLNLTAFNPVENSEKTQ